MNKELLLMVGNQMRGTHRITVGYSTAYDTLPCYGFGLFDNFGKIEPQEIGGFPIIALYDYAPFGIWGHWITFTKNSSINFQNITVTRMDNQKSVSVQVATKGETYLGSNQQLFQEEDVGKTIDLIIEAT